LAIEEKKSFDAKLKALNVTIPDDGRLKKRNRTLIEWEKDVYIDE